MQLLITTDRKPWFEGKARAKGETIETDDPAVIKHFTDHGFAAEVVAEKPAVPAKKVRAPKEGGDAGNS